MKNLVVIAMVVLIYLVSCNPVKVLNTEPAADFKLSDYKTFSFYDVQLNGDPVQKPYNDKIKILQEAITKQFEKKGLRWTQDEPDLLVNIGIVVDEKVQTRQTKYGSDGPFYAGQRRYSWKSEGIEVNRYNQGTVTIHLVDRLLNKMVWRGVAEAVIPKNKDLLKKDAEKGMEKLFSNLENQGAVSNEQERTTMK
jgi:hypothetical protein